MYTKNDVTAQMGKLDTLTVAIANLSSPFLNVAKEAPGMRVDLSNDPDLREAQENTLAQDYANLFGQRNRSLVETAEAGLAIIEKSLSRIRLLMSERQAIYGDDITHWNVDLNVHFAQSREQLIRVDGYTKAFDNFVPPLTYTAVSIRTYSFREEWSKASQWRNLINSRTPTKEEEAKFFADDIAMHENPNGYFADNTFALGQDFVQLVQASLTFLGLIAQEMALLNTRLVPFDVPYEKLGLNPGSSWGEHKKQLDTVFRTHSDVATKILETAGNYLKSAELLTPKVH